MQRLLLVEFQQENQFTQGVKPGNWEAIRLVERFKFLENTVFKLVVVVMFLSCGLFAQSPGFSAPAPTAANAQALSSVPPSDDLAQLRLDLDRLDSLLSNISSQTEFLRDQNLQILLRTNSQMWMILIRDMRRQLAREEQRRITQPTGAPKPEVPKHSQK